MKTSLLFLATLLTFALTAAEQPSVPPDAPCRPWLERIEQIMAAHPSDLGPALQADEALRNELVGLQLKLYAFCRDSANTAEARRPVRQWLAAHIAKYPQYLRRQHQDVKEQPFVPSLAYQTWTTLMLLPEGDPDAAAHRAFVADTIGFSGRLRDILVEFGTLIIENGSATANQQQTLYSYLSQIPKPLLGDRSIKRITEVITIGEYLGPRLDAQHEGGVNIFARDSGVVDSSENSFPKDFPGVKNDYFGLVLAHELNHRVDATRFAVMPQYNQRYWDHMQKACGDDVKFQQPSTNGVDWEATKKLFKDKGWWNGEAADWNAAWTNTGTRRPAWRAISMSAATTSPTRRARKGFRFSWRRARKASPRWPTSISPTAGTCLNMRSTAISAARTAASTSGCLDKWLPRRVAADGRRVLDGRRLHAAVQARQRRGQPDQPPRRAAPQRAGPNQRHDH